MTLRQQLQIFQVPRSLLEDSLVAPVAGQDDGHRGRGAGPGGRLVLPPVHFQALQLDAGILFVVVLLVRALRQVDGDDLGGQPRVRFVLDVDVLLLLGRIGPVGRGVAHASRSVGRHDLPDPVRWPAVRRRRHGIIRVG